MMVDWFEMKNLDDFEPEGEYEDLRGVVEMLYNKDNTFLWAFKEKNKVVAIASLANFRVGVGEAGMIMGNNISKVKLGLHRSTLKLLNYCHKELGLHRIQMSVEEDYHKGKRWAHSLGFLYEGTMKSFGFNKKNHLLFARIF